MSTKTVIAWWSGGVTSAVACRLALEKYDSVRLIYIETGSHHPDSLRFKADCERWYGRPIEVWQNTKYRDHFDVIERTRYINGPTGARCTLELKKKVRQRVEAEVPFSHQVYGFEFAPKQINRAIRWKEQYPQTLPLFPLIDARLSKNECAGIVVSAGIELPGMYAMGYENNNCIGCVKGGKGYWNRIRRDFPDTFARMAKDERAIGATCLKEDGGPLYLDELDPSAGNESEMVLPECGLFCQVEFAHIMDGRVEKILNGEIKIEDA